MYKSYYSLAAATARGPLTGSLQRRFSASASLKTANFQSDQPALRAKPITLTMHYTVSRRLDL